MYADKPRMNLSVRTANEEDFATIVNYFLKADEAFLRNMGADIAKLPKREEWRQLLAEDFQKPPEEKEFFYVIWQMNGVPVGHSNINKILFEEEAYMHLHIWSAENRKAGAGVQLVQQSLPYYFSIFKLKNLYCEPYAFNAAPNKALAKVGFDFIKQYETTPGWINFHQVVNRWCMPVEKFQSLQLKKISVL